MEIIGDRVKLRKLKISDAEDICDNLKSKEMVKWTLRLPWPYTQLDGIRWIRKVHYRSKKEKRYAFAVQLLAKKKLIGVISFIRIDWKNKNAEIGYWIGKNFWGKGFATEAVGLMLNFAFEELDFHRVYANLFEENIGSKKVLQKCGFKLEGVTRECIFRYGHWHNELRFGMLKSEYEQFSRRINNKERVKKDRLAKNKKAKLFL